MEKIVGKLIYSAAPLQVYEHPDGWIITDGTHTVITKQMPLLDEAALWAQLAPLLNNYENWQITRYGRIVPESCGRFAATVRDTLEVWIEKMAALEEMHVMGY